MFNLGLSEMILIGIIALIFIGPKQLPEIARTIGRMLNELKRATDDITTSITDPKAYNRKQAYEEEHQRFMKKNQEQEAKLVAESKATNAESVLPASTNEKALTGLETPVQNSTNSEEKESNS
jgi:sec-independent protein translocase protein TatB